MNNRYIIRGFGLRKNLYWNGCGWTEFKKTANIYGKADGEQLIANLAKDRIMAERIKA